MEKNSKVSFGQIFQKYGVFLILLGMIIIISVLSPSFLMPKNLIM